MPVKTSTRRKGCRGNAMMELVLIAPWIFLLFIGALDWGFYASALVSLQAAARSAALYTSGGTAVAADQTNACIIVLKEIRKLPNIGTSVTTCDSNPIVTATSLTGGASPDGSLATQVSITYQSISLIPIPGLLAKQFTVTRTVKMRVRS
jgi:Flp pilus assembly protein TadG